MLNGKAEWLGIRDGGLHVLDGDGAIAAEVGMIVHMAGRCGKLADGVADVEALGRHALAVPTDVSDAAALGRLADAAFGRFVRVDVLCLNAGFAILKPFGP